MQLKCGRLFTFHSSINAIQHYDDLLTDNEDRQLSENGDNTRDDVRSNDRHDMRPSVQMRLSVARPIGKVK